MLNLSIVIPIHNEEQNIPILYKELKQVLEKLKKSYEIVFVDDGSKDNSFKILSELAKKDKKVKIVKLLSNYGQSSAISSGIQNASGENIVTMDSDLQHNPEDIPYLIEPLKEYHVVCGRRIKRPKNESFLTKTLPSKFSNYLINKLTGLNLKETTGGMRAFKKQVTDNIDIYGEMHRYLPILAAWKGFKITEAGINIRDRKFGKTHYNFKRLFRGFLDLLTIKFLISYSTRPLYIFGGTGLVSFAIGFLIALYLTIQKLFFNLAIGTKLPLFMLSILLMISGIIFLCFGFIADMISLNSIKQRKQYIIEKVI